MFHKLDTHNVSSGIRQVAEKKDIDSNLEPEYHPMALEFLKQARAQLLIALSRYKAAVLEDGYNCKYIYPGCPSRRQTKLSDIVGPSDHEDDNLLSLWDLLASNKKINTKNLINLMRRLSKILQPMPGFPPLKKASQINIKNAIVLLFKTMRRQRLFPAKSPHVSIKVIVILAKSIDKQKLQHLLYQEPDLIKEIHNNANYKNSLTLVEGLPEAVGALYQNLFPLQALQTRLSTAINYYSFRLFQAVTNPFTTLNSASTPEEPGPDSRIGPDPDVNLANSPASMHQI